MIRPRSRRRPKREGVKTVPIRRDQHSIHPNLNQMIPLSSIGPSELRPIKRDIQQPRRGDKLNQLSHTI